MKKQFSSLYQPARGEIVEVDVPSFTYLMIDGEGDPNSSEPYARAVEALFSVSYAAKFLVKQGAPDRDYVVMPLEGLWWADDPAVFVSGDRSRWRWTMMVAQPSFVGTDVLDAARAKVRAKGLPTADQLRVETFTEGRCAQVLHIGPFSEEGPVIERLHRFATERGSLFGKHHEIYLSDIRRADPRRWRTVIRQPMR